MSEFEEIKQKRERFLRAAYDLGKNRPLRMVRLEDIAQAMGMNADDLADEDELIDIASYLEDRGFIERQADGYGLLNITSRGIDEVEEGYVPVPRRTWADVLHVTPGESRETSVAAETPVEIRTSIKRLREDYPDPTTVAFIMMRFGSTEAHNRIARAIKDALAEHGITGLRADDKRYHNYLLYNVMTYMHGCGLGVAVFERIEKDTFNPNVSLEVGYMLAMGKEVCLLKDQTLQAIQTDLIGALYDPFDPQHPAETIPPAVQKWLSDKGLSRS